MFSLRFATKWNARDKKGISVMGCRHLRIYHGPESLSTLADESHVESTVRVSFGEIYPLLADAVNNRRTWLGDFDQDEITISSDLYETLLAYQHHRRPSA